MSKVVCRGGSTVLLTNLFFRAFVLFEGTTKDGMFTLLEVECLGACANAPMVQVSSLAKNYISLFRVDAFSL